MKKTLKKAYRNLRSLAPSSINGILSKLAFKFRNKPICKKDNINPLIKFPSREKGGLILSADFEMAWAWRYTKTEFNHIKKGRLERENLPEIINLLTEYNIPITFATVGHLFLEHCKKGDHDWMSRIPYFDDHWKFKHGDWYDHDPYATFSDAPEWYAPDLIRMILNSPVEHEISTHSFSHMDFSDKNCPPEVANDEVTACEEATKPYGISLESIVFPGGTWGNIEVLKKHGIKIYRKNEDYDLAYPYRDSYGLLVTNNSGPLEYNRDYGWTPQYFISRLKKYVDKAIETSTIAHFWFHPSLDPFFLKNIFPPFLEYTAFCREKGDLWIGTMKDIARYINENRIL